MTTPTLPQATPATPMPGRLTADAPAQALMATARQLRQTAATGQARGLLRGKNIGLLCERPDGPEAVRFQLAAAELGATVARILPSLAALESDQQVTDTARVLGRLYDALECQGLPAPLVQQLQRSAGVPVFGGLGELGHPIDALATAWAAGEPPLTPEAARRYLLQAVLVQGIT
jgi:ornithine carbamoyltransferase